MASPGRSDPEGINGLTIVDADGAARRWRDEAIRQASAPGVRALAVNTGSPDQHRPDQPRPAYKCGGCRLWVNDAHPDWYGHSEHCTRDSDVDSEGGGRLLPGATDIDGWPLAMPDDRLPLGDDDELPEKPSPLERITRPVRLRDDADRLPAILTRDDGETLLYASKLNSVYGLPAVGKSWVALICAVKVLEAGGRVVWWDFEDVPDTLARRSMLLGALDDVADTDRFRMIAPDADEAGIAAAVEWLTGHDGLVVIDAAESAGCPSDGAAVTDWYQTHVDWWRPSGAAILLLDHIPKRRTDRPRGAIGSQHKLARIDGAALRADGKPWTKQLGGTLLLTVEKDRPGDIIAPAGSTVAAIVGSYDEHGGFGYRIAKPDPNMSAVNDTTTEDRIAADIWKTLQATADGLTITALRKAVKGNNNLIAIVAERMAYEGALTKSPDGVYRIATTTNDTEPF